GDGHMRAHPRSRLRRGDRQWVTRAGQGRSGRGERLPRCTVTDAGAKNGNAIPPILELRDVRAGYGPIEVVHGVSLEVATGSVMALLGPNGGGKTTMLNVCSGTLGPNSGDVCFEGAVVTKSSADDRARMGICT